jgi:hypothetical protein
MPCEAGWREFLRQCEEFEHRLNKETAQGGFVFTELEWGEEGRCGAVSVEIRRDVSTPPRRDWRSGD